MKHWTYAPKTTGDLVATDLHAEADGITDAEAYTITIYGDDDRLAPEAAEALYLPSTGRLGIAWGADATWADVRNVEDGIEMWLNEPEEWEAAN